MASLRVLLGVTGGIAAYKAVELCRLLQAAGHEVTVMQTRAAQAFVGAATFAALTGRPVHTDAGAEAAATSSQADGGVFPHLDAARSSDVLVIAPATANMLARLAGGIADDILSATYLAFTGPVIVAPAMNTNMWNHPATRRNLDRLRADGVTIVQPEAGLLACGDIGAGRLAHVDEISATIEQVAAAVGVGAHSRDLEGVTVLVTAGGTREPIDGVRFLGNRSSGRMGIALAQAARERGAEVRLVVTRSVDPALLSVPAAATVETAAQLQSAIDEQLPDSDVVLMAAAVSDFTVPGPADGAKLERGPQTLQLQPTADLLAGLAERRAGSHDPLRPLLVGFAAERGADGVERARAKRERKGVDLIVHNDVARPEIGFESTDNEVTILGDGLELHVPLASKLQVAHVILDQVAQLRHARANA